MKNLKYIMLGCLLVAGATSCKKYLDVNTDPDNPNNQSVSVQNRLPWIQHFYQYSAGVTNYRTACIAGVCRIVDRRDPRSCSSRLVRRERHNRNPIKGVSR